LPGGSAEPPAGAYALAVGDLRAKKNTARLLEAFELARGRGLAQRLIVAGRGDPPLRPEGAEFPGFVGAEELDALYRGADFLVYPSLYEGFGLAALEAMERGCPVALSRATSLPEVGGEAALYFDPQSAGAIAEAMLGLGADEALRARLSEAGRARAAQFSWERAAVETAAIYREAATERSGA